MAQTIALSLLGAASYFTFQEAKAVIAANSKNLTIIQMSEGDLQPSISSYSNRQTLQICFNSMNSFLALLSDHQNNINRANQCKMLARNALKKNPTMGIAWVVLADSDLTLGGTDDAINNILSSQKVSPREGWLAKARLIVYLKMPPEVLISNYAGFKSDVAVIATNLENVDFLAYNWKNREDLRGLIESGIQDAPVNFQKRFIRSVRS
jgi:hypothetical protein